MGLAIRETGICAFMKLVFYSNTLIRSFASYGQQGLQIEWDGESLGRVLENH